MCQKRAPIDRVQFLPKVCLINLFNGENYLVNGEIARGLKSCQEDFAKTVCFLFSTIYTSEYGTFGSTIISPKSRSERTGLTPF